ncbi:hypothetical protein H1R20_g14483, partial [Candolleomyces eurysporus]
MQSSKYPLTLSRATTKKRVIHDCLVKREAYQDLYLIMRERHKGLVGSWKEVTDPYKHVFEDIGIATFLMLLWKDTYASPGSPVVDGEGDAEPWKRWPRPPGGFIDFGCVRSSVFLLHPIDDNATSLSSFSPSYLALRLDRRCGNGLLTHILVSEGYEGVGIDLRARTSWEHYPQASRDALRVCAFSPFDLVPEAASPSPSPQPGSASPVPPCSSFDFTDSKDASSPDASPASRSNDFPVSCPNDSPSSSGSTDGSKAADSSSSSSSIFKPHAFIIANHADELTPWVPVVATLTDASGYLSIPCCAWGFDRKFEKGMGRMFDSSLSNERTEDKEEEEEGKENQAKDQEDKEEEENEEVFIASLNLGGRTRTRTDDALKQEMMNIIEEVRKRGLFKTRKPEGKTGEH